MTETSNCDSFGIIRQPEPPRIPDPFPGLPACFRKTPVCESSVPFIPASPGLDFCVKWFSRIFAAGLLAIVCIPFLYLLSLPWHFSAVEFLACLWLLDQNKKKRKGY